jgi:hypothetical protein
MIKPDDAKKDGEVKTPEPGQPLVNTNDNSQPDEKSFYI